MSRKLRQSIKQQVSVTLPKRSFMYIMVSEGNGSVNSYFSRAAVLVWLLGIMLGIGGAFFPGILTFRKRREKE